MSCSLTPQTNPQIPMPETISSYPHRIFTTLIVFGGLYLLGLTVPSSAVFAELPESGTEEPLSGVSERLQKSSALKVGAKAPFFSGWLAKSPEILNLTKLLRQKKRRYVVTVCNSHCTPCFSGLWAISNAQIEFQKRGIRVVIYVADNEKNARRKM